MGAMSVGHWLIVMVVIAVVFGPKRLGSVGKGLGEGIKGLKDGLAGREDEEPGRVAEGRADRSCGAACASERDLSADLHDPVGGDIEEARRWLGASSQKRKDGDAPA